MFISIDGSSDAGSRRLGMTLSYTPNYVTTMPVKKSCPPEQGELVISGDRLRAFELCFSWYSSATIFS